MFNTHMGMRRYSTRNQSPTNAMNTSGGSPDQTKQPHIYFQQKTYEPIFKHRTSYSPQQHLPKCINKSSILSNRTLMDENVCSTLDNSSTRPHPRDYLSLQVGEAELEDDSMIKQSIISSVHSTQSRQVKCFDMTYLSQGGLWPQRERSPPAK